jgi:hypothetical protein
MRNTTQAAEPLSKNLPGKLSINHDTLAPASTLLGLTALEHSGPGLKHHQPRSQTHTKRSARWTTGELSAYVM